MWNHSIWNFLVEEGHEITEWAKCGDDYLSTVPTLLWAVGASAFAHRLLHNMFRRFLFRRVPLWEQILQGEILVDEDNLASLHFMEQWVIWLCGAIPIATYMYTRQQSADPPLMIW
ncbi:unnamed protein product, partial [Iphiclides podalirius]